MEDLKGLIQNLKILKGSAWTRQEAGLFTPIKKKKIITK